MSRDESGLEYCDICIKKDDKCNHCQHCNREICQYCSKFGGPKPDFHCSWNHVDGVICSDCLEWKSKHFELTRRYGWTRDPYASDSDNEEDPDNPDKNDEDSN